MSATCIDITAYTGTQTQCLQYKQELPIHGWGHESRFISAGAEAAGQKCHKCFGVGREVDVEI